jgi:hypothetical protein
MWPRALLTVALRGPGKVLWVASAVGWIAMAVLLTGDPVGHTALGHSGHTLGLSAPESLVGGVAAVWVVMILAMSPPLLLREIGRLWRASRRRLRHLTIVWFVCGYLGVWLLSGASISTLAGWVTGEPGRVVFAVAVVALWQCSPVRQRCLNACHRVPTLRVFGAAAQWDSLRYGASTGAVCAAVCGPLMLLALLATDYHFAAMALAAGVATIERHLPAKRPRWHLPFVRDPLDWPDMAVGAERMPVRL